ncbi:phosphatase PAP2 family protein [Variovorax sp. OV329]|uniref:phosphatase PAP2 family protein n=1 Tax=Variovorax sp. OV329 TaxID=1882825 RepID=UPI000B84D1B5|nr:phosphatase PAP2 family protein [Variovorax sp. OV329]
MQSADVYFYLLLNADSAWPLWSIRLFTWIGDWLPKALMVLPALLALALPAWRRTLWLAVCCLAITWLMVRVFRTWLPMPRPDALNLGMQWLPQGARPGFPSMHAAGSFGVAVVMLMSRGGPLAWAYLLAAALISASRVVLGLHFPLDIVVGALLGSLVAVGVVGAANRAVLAGRVHSLRRLRAARGRGTRG